MPDLSRVAFVVLAAGAGRRFGGGKLDAELDGRPLGQWATNAVEAAGAIHRFIVVGPSAPQFVSKLGDWKAIINPDADRGIGSSIKAAVSVAREFDRLILVLADMPFVKASHLARLAAGRDVMFTRYSDGNPGVPAGFPATAFARLLQIPDARGASAIFKELASSSVATSSIAELVDVDTQTDLSEAIARKSDS